MQNQSWSPVSCEQEYPAAAIFPCAPVGEHEMLGHLPLKQTQSVLLYQKKQAHHTTALVLPQCTHKTLSFSSLTSEQGQKKTKDARWKQAVCLCQSSPAQPTQTQYISATESRTVSPTSQQHWQEESRLRAKVWHTHVFKDFFSPQHRTTSSSLFEDVRMRLLENK